MKEHKRVMTVVAMVLVLVLAVAGSVLAFGTMPERNPSGTEMELNASVNRAPAPHMCGRAGFEAAAKALGMSSEDLRIQLWGGRTLAELAEEKGVDLKDVYTAVRRACEKPIRDAIAKAVTNKRISQEEADWLLEGLDKGYWGPTAKNSFLKRFCGTDVRKPAVRIGRKPVQGPRFRHSFPPSFPNRWNR